MSEISLLVLIVKTIPLLLLLLMGGIIAWRIIRIFMK